VLFNTMLFGRFLVNILPFIVLSLDNNWGACQTYTSTHHLEQLSKEEGRLVTSLQTYVETSKTNDTEVSDVVIR